MGNKTVVLGVLEDIHALGVIILRGAFEQAGFKVVYVGERATQEDFIHAAVETNAGAILISTSTGHAELDCQGMKEKCREAGLDHTLLYLGGNLIIDPQNEQKWEAVENRFKQMGFDRVYPPNVSIDPVLKDLKGDLALS
jgi:methylaspartate mutase sigma subunit